MRTPHLEFATQPPRASLGWVVLFAGLAALTASWVEHQALQADMLQAEARLAKARGAAGPMRAIPMDAGADKRMRQDVGNANVILAQLNLPWDSLFTALEAASVEGVVLLSVQPDVVAGQVRIAGEAGAFDRALSYVGRLEESPHFANVFLSSHEVRTATPRRPVLFSLTADWSER